MPRYLLTIEYDGSTYYGWQRQPDVQSVQGEIEKVFSQILQQEIEIFGQGRTDRGVHALGQTAHVDVSLEPEEVQKFHHAANQLLPEAIYIRSIHKVRDEFHARFDALSRSYEYRIRTAKRVHHRQNELQLSGAFLDVEAMKLCAEILKGELDFSLFSKPDPEIPHSRCTILKADWLQEKDLITFQIEGNRFLRNMVRRLVGAMVAVGKGELTVSNFQELCDPHSNEVEKAKYTTAPPHGLFLVEVKYSIEK